jgi:hypothetical protein
VVALTDILQRLSPATARPARWLLAVLLVCVSTGCVQRRLTIRSNPPGALVLVDNYEIGTTPCSTDFIYYGTRKIQLVKDGFETLTLLQPIPTPWYEYPGLDFVSENLVPGEIRDERVLSFNLQPQIIVPTEQLLGRAENLRRSSPQPIGPAPPGVVPVPPAPVYTGPPGAAPQQPFIPPQTLPPPQNFQQPPQFAPPTQPQFAPQSPPTGQQPFVPPQQFGPQQPFVPPTALPSTTPGLPPQQAFPAPNY